MGAESSSRLALVGRLERHLQGVLAADFVWELPGWRCLATRGGAVQRVNSAVAAGRLRGSAHSPSQGEEMEFAHLRAVAASYAARGLVPLVRLTPLDRPEVSAQIQALGWAVGGETLVMCKPLAHTASLATAQGGGADGTAPSMLAAASSGWQAVHLAGHSGPEAEQRLALSVAARGGAKAYCEMADSAGRVFAIGLGVVEAGMIGIYDLLTLEHHRRSGHGRRVLDALLAWGGSLGAELACLQVSADNVAAAALYRSSGFEVVYSYSYARPAGSSTVRP